MKTQKEIVMDYVNQHGSIVPARMGGKITTSGFFGSEVSRVCRKLREEGKLTSPSKRVNGKFKIFFKKNNEQKQWNLFNRN